MNFKQLNTRNKSIDDRADKNSHFMRVGKFHARHDTIGDEHLLDQVGLDPLNKGNNTARVRQIPIEEMFELQSNR